MSRWKRIKCWARFHDWQFVTIFDIRLRRRLTRTCLRCDLVEMRSGKGWTLLQKRRQ